MVDSHDADRITMSQELRRLLSAEPFVPFVVTMSNGRTYRVGHPENAVLSKHFLVVVSGEENEDIDNLYLLHIASLSPEKAPAGGRPN
ncbi:MAG: hypothetical protein AAGD07_01875 [Planctomycetota bacterium]